MPLPYCRPARDHDAPGPGRVAEANVGNRNSLVVLRNRPEAFNPVSSIPGSLSWRTRLGFELPHTVGELRRMVQFKDKESRRDEAGATAGLFTYPVLQAADILLYQADSVPVGEDQKQHLELARDLAQRFNNRFSVTFTVPEPLIAPMGARVMDLQNPHKKMSKSSESPLGTIRLIDRPEEIQAKIQSAVTDSGCEIRTSIDKPAISNLLEIYSIVGGVDIHETEEVFAGKTYAQLKKALADRLMEYLRPIRDRYEQIEADRDRIEGILVKGSEKAKAMAAQTLTSVYDHLGFVQPRTHLA